MPGGDSSTKDITMIKPPIADINARPKTLEFDCASGRIFCHEVSIYVTTILLVPTHTPFLVAFRPRPEPFHPASEVEAVA